MSAKGELPTIENRRARFEYHIEQTLECGIALQGSEIKSIRAGEVSLQEGFIRVKEIPPELTLHKVHIGEYKPAGVLGHAPARVRVLLARKSEIVRIARAMTKGMTIVPLKIYFKGPWAKVLIGVGKGKKAHDKRNTIKQRESDRELKRLNSKRV
jgi:SsrA-binding protein